ncbi:MAG: ATP-binding protein [Bacteroidales bacterium]|nr:ATP-binding protein [Bacteroidales bacterium]
MAENYINRTLETTLLEAWKYFPVLAVTGPRQSGKSTLIRHLFPEASAFSLKDINVLDFALNDPLAFLGQTSEPIFIDEIQKAPVLLEYIQGIVDRDSQRKFILSGSSNFELMKGLSESLAGRSGVFELLPMSFSETEESASRKDLNTLLFDGFYPSVITGKNIASLYYPSYVKTYLEKDVRDLLNVKNMMQFMRFMKLCAARVGSIFNASELSSEVGVDNKTINSWLSVLQASYVVYLLPPYYENITKRLIKSPKLYFCDPGLACYLLDIETPAQLSRDKMRGNIFENFIVMETVKHRLNKGKDGGVYFYRDSNQNEVDLLLKEEGAITAVEVKSSQTYSSSFEDCLKKLPEWLQTPVKRKAVVYTGEFENAAGNIEVLNYKHFTL